MAEHSTTLDDRTARWRKALLNQAGARVPAAGDDLRALLVKYCANQANQLEDLSIMSQRPSELDDDRALLRKIAENSADLAESGGGSGTETVEYASDIADATALAAETAGPNGDWAEGTLLVLADGSKYAVEAGTDATNSPLIIRAANYAGGSEEWLFVKKG